MHCLHLGQTRSGKDYGAFISTLLRALEKTSSRWSITSKMEDPISSSTRKVSRFTSPVASPARSGGCCRMANWTGLEVHRPQLTTVRTLIGGSQP